MNADGILTAIEVVGIVYVSHGSLSFVVVDVDVLGSRDFVELKVFSVYFVTSIFRKVIHDHGEVVAVVLSKYGVEGVLYAEFGVVVKTGRYDAHRQLGTGLFKLEKRIDPVVLQQKLLGLVLVILPVNLHVEKTLLNGLQFVDKILDKALPLFVHLHSLFS